MGAVNDGKHSMIRYYINNFTDGYNNDCLDLSQGAITSQQKLNSRGFVSPLKLAMVGLIGTLVFTHFFLQQTFPRPEALAEGMVDQDSTSLKMLAFHSIVYVGVFLVGVLGIMHNGRSFVDDTSRLNL